MAPAATPGRPSTRLLLVATVVATLDGFLLPYGRHFRRKGWTVDAAAHGAAGSPLCAEVFDNSIDIPWSRSSFAVWQNLNAFVAIRTLLQEGSYDIVHVHTPIASILTRFASATLRRKTRPVLIYTAHGFHFHGGGAPVTNRVYRYVERLGGFWTDYLVVINEEDRRAALSQRLVPHERVRYMPGIGVDLDQYRSTIDSTIGDNIRRELAIPIEAPLLLMVGELVANKRPRDAILALSLMTNRSTHLVMAGGGPLEGELRRLCVRFGVGNRVHLLGFRRDVVSLMQAADILVMTSQREGLPRSVMEAQAIGLPVVGTDVRGIRDLLNDGRGSIVPLGQPRSLADELDRLLEDPEEADLRADFARASVGRYELKGVIRMHEALYKEALDSMRLVRRGTP